MNKNYEEVIKSYENDPDYIIGPDELRDNLINVSNFLNKAMTSIAFILDNIRVKSEMCAYNFKDVNDGRISNDLFIERTDDDLKSIRQYVANSLDETTNGQIYTKLLTSLVNGKWNLNSENHQPQNEIPHIINIDPQIQPNNIHVQPISVSHPELVAIAQPVYNLPLANLPSRLQTNDKFFYVLLTANKEDGPPEYIRKALAGNFRRMFPASYSAIANVYSTTDDPPQLHGLIRYNHKNEYNISVGSSHIRNFILPYNESMKNKGRKEKRHHHADSLTTYEGRQYVTERQAVIDAYSNIINYGTAVGDQLDNFLN